MKILIKILVLYVGLITFAYANICEDERMVNNILAQAKIKPSEGSMIDCKSDPMNEANVILAYVRPINIQDSEPSNFRLSILKFDRENLRLNDSYHSKEEIVSDAVSLTSIQLDTANYKINKTNRVLGVRLHYSLNSSVNPFSMTLLNLYDFQNKKQVLDSLIVKQYRAETDTRCNADVEERTSTLSMQNTLSNQAFDILLKSRIDHSIFEGTRENCKESKKPTTLQKFTLKFDGQQYRIPKPFKDEYLYK